MHPTTQVRSPENPKPKSVRRESAAKRVCMIDENLRPELDFAILRQTWTRIQDFLRMLGRVGRMNGRSPYAADARISRTRREASAIY